MNDRPIHLKSSTEPHTEASVTCPVWLTQSSLDGLQTLIQFLNGLAAGGAGQVPGHHELIMFYRMIQRAVFAHYQEQAIPLVTENAPKKKSALEQFNENGFTAELSPLERLGFFCSFAMNAQDWLDAEVFFTSVLEAQSASPADSESPAEKSTLDLLRAAAARQKVEKLRAFLRDCADPVDGT